MLHFVARTRPSPASRTTVDSRPHHLLDQLQPERLDPAQQVIEPDNGETWVQLRQDVEPYLRSDSS